MSFEICFYGQGKNNIREGENLNRGISDKNKKPEDRVLYKNMSEIESAIKKSKHRKDRIQVYVNYFGHLDKDISYIIEDLKRFGHQELQGEEGFIERHQKITNDIKSELNKAMKGKNSLFHRYAKFSPAYHDDRIAGEKELSDNVKLLSALHDELIDKQQTEKNKYDKGIQEKIAKQQEKLVKQQEYLFSIETLEKNTKTFIQSCNDKVKSGSYALLQNEVTDKLKSLSYAITKCEELRASSQKSGADPLVNLGQKRHDESSSANLPQDIEMILRDEPGENKLWIEIKWGDKVNNLESLSKELQDVSKTIKEAEKTSKLKIYAEKVHDKLPSQKMKENAEILEKDVKNYSNARKDLENILGEPLLAFIARREERLYQQEQSLEKLKQKTKALLANFQRDLHLIPSSKEQYNQLEQAATQAQQLLKQSLKEIKEESDLSKTKIAYDQFKEQQRKFTSAMEGLKNLKDDLKKSVEDRDRHERIGHLDNLSNLLLDESERPKSPDDFEYMSNTINDFKTHTDTSRDEANYLEIITCISGMVIKNLSKENKRAKEVIHDLRKESVIDNHKYDEYAYKMRMYENLEKTKNKPTIDDFEYYVIDMPPQDRKESLGLLLVKQHRQHKVAGDKYEDLKASYGTMLEFLKMISDNNMNPSSENKRSFERLQEQLSNYQKNLKRYNKSIKKIIFDYRKHPDYWGLKKHENWEQAFTTFFQKFDALNGKLTKFSENIGSLIGDIEESQHTNSQSDLANNAQKLINLIDDFHELHKGYLIMNDQLIKELEASPLLRDKNEAVSAMAARRDQSSEG